MFQLGVIDYSIADRETKEDRWDQEDTHNEFWEDVYSSKAESLQKLPSDPNTEREEGLQLLSGEGWADMKYFSNRRRDNKIYSQLIHYIRSDVRECHVGSDEEFQSAMWLVRQSTRDRLYESEYPEKLLRIFVMLPYEGKEWILEKHKDRSGPQVYYVMFLFMHFPSVFPLTGRWSNVSEDGNSMIETYFTEQIRSIPVDYYSLVHSFTTIPQVFMIYLLLAHKHDCRMSLGKIYFALMMETPQFALINAQTILYTLKLQS